MTEPRTRLVHLITRLDLGGAQQNTLYCAERHDRTRFEVSLWAGRGGLLDGEAAAIADADVRLFPWLVHSASPLRDAVALVRLTGALRRLRPALIHTHSSKAGVLGRIAARLARVPAVVHTVHGWSFNPTQPLAARRGAIALERVVARATDALICVSEADRAEGLRLRIAPAERFHVIRSGIDMARYAPRAGARETFRRELGWGDDLLVVGTLACLKPQKAPLDFVAAAAAASRVDPSLRFFMAGDGAQRGEVEREIARQGLGGTVRVLGWRRDVETVLAGTDLFLLTSRFEGLPRAVLQAMAAGVPVVATAVNGTPEVVRHGASGLLVAAGRPDEAAEAVLVLARDPALRRRFAEAARARLDSEFDVAAMLRSIEGLYATRLGVGAPSFARASGGV